MPQEVVGTLPQGIALAPPDLGGDDFAKLPSGAVAAVAIETLRLEPPFSMALHRMHKSCPRLHKYAQYEEYEECSIQEMSISTDFKLRILTTV